MAPKLYQAGEEMSLISQMIDQLFILQTVT